MENQQSMLTSRSAVNSLSALIHGSPTFHQVIDRTYWQEVLSKVLCDQIAQGGGSLQDSIATLLSASLRLRCCHSDLADVVPFLDRYKDDMFRYQQTKTLYLEDYLAMSMLERMEKKEADLCTIAPAPIGIEPITHHTNTLTSGRLP